MANKTVKLEVLDRCEWAIHSGACYSLNGGIFGQVTKLKFMGVVFYVRENLQHAKPSFHMSANERLGMKQGNVPKHSVEVLELACDKNVRVALKAAVEREEQGPRGRGRVVRDHRLFTVAWAEDRFRSRDSGRA